MKICPRCHTKYTDETLKFCLQDGNILEPEDGHKTEVFDPNVFAGEATVAENFAEGTTEHFTDRTEEYRPRPTDNKQQPSAENISRVTVIRPREFTQPAGIGEPTRTKKSGLGFLTGLIVGVFLIGLCGLLILGVVYLPGLLESNTNSAGGNENAGSVKERVLSDSADVKVTASSTRRTEQGNSYAAGLAFDGNSRTAWSEGVKGAGKGQWIVFDFRKEEKLDAVRIEPGYFKSAEIWRKNNRLATVDLQFSDGTTRTFRFSDTMKEQKIAIGGVRTRSVKITIRDIYAGQSDSEDTLISEVSFIVE
jgi:hypothetical protein